MTREEQDYEHLSKVLDSYVIRDNEARLKYVRMELIKVARLRDSQLEVVLQGVAKAVAREAENDDNNSFIRQHMATVKQTLNELTQSELCKK